MIKRVMINNLLLIGFLTFVGVQSHQSRLGSLVDKESVSSVSNNGLKISIYDHSLKAKRYDREYVILDDAFLLNKAEWYQIALDTEKYLQGKIGKQNNLFSAITLESKGGNITLKSQDKTINVQEQIPAFLALYNSWAETCYSKWGMSKNTFNRELSNFIENNPNLSVQDISNVLSSFFEDSQSLAYVSHLKIEEMYLVPSEVTMEPGFLYLYDKIEPSETKYAYIIRFTDQLTKLSVIDKYKMGGETTEAFKNRSYIIKQSNYR